MNLLLLAPEQIQGDQATISDQRRIAHIHQHLAMQVGDTIRTGLINGLRGTARITSMDAQQITLGKLMLDSPPPAKTDLILVVCLPRPPMLRRLVIDSVSMGITRLILLHSSRVEKSYWQSPRLRELDDYVLLGLEQAGDTVWPQIQLQQRFRPFVEDDLPALCHDRLALVAHPYASQPMPRTLNQPALIVIGPEGGLIPYEVDLLTQHGLSAVTLGTRILRTEAAINAIMGRCLP